MILSLQSYADKQALILNEYRQGFGLYGKERRTETIDLELLVLGKDEGEFNLSDNKSCNGFNIH